MDGTKMHRANFSTDEIPIEARERAQHLWVSIKNLVEVKKPEDEPQVVVLIASLLMMYTMLGDLSQHIRQSPAYQSLRNSPPTSRCPAESRTAAEVGSD